MANRTIRTIEAEEKITAKLRNGWSISAACRAAKIGRSAFYEWCRDDIEFRTKIEESMEDGTDRLEDEATRQALNGNSTLMVLLLKARRRDKYSDKAELKISLSLQEKARAIADKLGTTEEEVLETAKAVASGAWDSWQPE